MRRSKAQGSFTALYKMSCFTCPAQSSVSVIERFGRVCPGCCFLSLRFGKL